MLFFRLLYALFLVKAMAYVTASFLHYQYLILFLCFVLTVLGPCVELYACSAFLITVFILLFTRRRASIIALMMEAASTSETSVYFYQTTRRNIREDKPSSYSPP
jgi:hypothetical protein